MSVSGLRSLPVGFALALREQAHGLSQVCLLSVSRWYAHVRVVGVEAGGNRKVGAEVAVSPANLFRWSEEDEARMQASAARAQGGAS